MTEYPITYYGIRTLTPMDYAGVDRIHIVHIHPGWDATLLHPMEQEILTHSRELENWGIPVTYILDDEHAIPGDVLSGQTVVVGGVYTTDCVRDQALALAGAGVHAIIDLALSADNLDTRTALEIEFSQALP